MALTKKETKILIDVLDQLEVEFAQGGEAGAQAEMVDSDENFVYLDAWFEDGSCEQLKLRREMLTSGEDIESIASSIW